MGIPNLKTKEKFSYADYLTWNDGERWEIIEGIPYKLHGGERSETVDSIPYNMSPAPRRMHQTISGNLFNEFRNYLKGKKCKVFPAPFDVRLPSTLISRSKKISDELIETIIQPDISIFCDVSKLDSKGAVGAPDLIVEILSKSSYQRDLNLKLLLYQKFRVQEYWIIDPDTETLNVYILDKKGRYELVHEYTKKDKAKVSIFPDLEIDLDFVFEE